ncbi:MAG TPA: hypothetical protein VEX13_04400 [Chloroflexia bacterium]|nr:hypothetical protein [Chloroflexia bacterium]
MSTAPPLTSGVARAAQPPDTARRWLLVLLAALCAGAVSLASLRHTGSLAFPIDDGYIYSNYVLSASQGHFFTYNLGQTSGGITGVGWYLLCVATYILLAPFHSLLAILGPPTFDADSALATQAGHLYLAAYLPGVVCLAATALGVQRLADLVLPQALSGESTLWRGFFCWLIGAIAAADLGLVWGAMSGLEVTFASAVAVWGVALLLEEARRGLLKWSLVLAALLPLARPDLIAVGIAGLLWLVVRALLREDQAEEGIAAFRHVALYLAALLAGAGLMSLLYLAGWGQPLPASFYAKVGGLRVGRRFFAAAEELLIAARFLPFVAGAAAVLGSGLQMLAGSSGNKADREDRLAALLLFMVSVTYVGAVMTTLPWFGQEDRYLLPAHPFITIQIGMLAWLAARRLPVDRLLTRRRILPALMVVAVLLLVVANYLWATRDYAVEVRNIEDAHVKPAFWLAEMTPPGSLVASEPIGAVKLFSGRPTIDLVGLTSPEMLTTYRNWPETWRALREAGAGYLLYYPAWFGREGPPAWAIERATFTIPDNKIAGDDTISIYELDWTRYSPP